MNSLPNNILLENDWVRLEELNESHLKDLGEIALQYPDLLCYSPTAFGSVSAIEDMISNAKLERTEGNRIAFAIFNKKTRKYAGSTSYGAISLYNRRIEIGWTWVSKEQQGTGINKSCKHLMLTYAFDQMKMERVELKTDLRNLQSQKAMEKIGATREGVLRSHTLMLDGHRRDTVYYSILKNEWPEISKRYFADSDL